MSVNAMAGSLTGTAFGGWVAPVNTPGSSKGPLAAGLSAASGISPWLRTRQIVVAEPGWIGHLNNSARNMSALKAGWDGPGSLPVSRKALFWATSNIRSALEGIDDAEAPHLVPGGDGSLQIEWHEKHAELEFDVGPLGQMYIWIRDHRNGAEFDAENEAALALFYRWAPWIASKQLDDLDDATQTKAHVFTIAA